MPEPPLVAEWQRVTHRLLAELDARLPALTAGEANALASFAGESALAVRHLVHATGQKPSTLTGVLDRLERRGLVVREPDPGDRRALRAVLTPEGREAAGAVAEAFAAVERRIPDAARVRALLRELEDALG